VIKLANQSFTFNNFRIGKIDYRLAITNELFAFNCLNESIIKTMTFFRAYLHTIGEEMPTIFSRALYFIHRLARLGKKRLNLSPILEINGDAYARSTIDSTIHNRKRRISCLYYILRDFYDRSGIVYIFDNDNKLFAAITCNSVATLYTSVRDVILRNRISFRGCVVIFFPSHQHPAALPNGN
jgi:hypothetical protein